MRVLVIGANGQVGSELRWELRNRSEWSDKQHHVIFSDRGDLDLGHIERIPQYLDYVEPDIIVNASAYTAVDLAETQRDKAFLINETVVKELAHFCSERNGRLIHISTDYVFDGTGEKPHAENDSVGPAGVYGCSKLAGEEAIREVLDEHIIIRTSWVFGASGSNFVKTMLRLGEEKRELQVVADQYGAPTSARAIAQTIVAIISRLMSEPHLDQFWGTYHYSGLPFVSWAGFAKEIFEQATQFGLIPASPTIREIATTDYPTPAARPANSRLDCSKLKGVFDVEPDDWKTSLSFMLDALKKGMRH